MLLGDMPKLILVDEMLEYPTNARGISVGDTTLREESINFGSPGHEWRRQWRLCRGRSLRFFRGTGGTSRQHSQRLGPGCGNRDLGDSRWSVVKAQFTLPCKKLRFVFVNGIFMVFLDKSGKLSF